VNSDAVVINAGPLMALSKLNILHLLKALYRKVEFTRGVYDEVVVEGMRRGYDDAQALHLFLEQEDWQPTAIETIPVELAEAALDQGELESIALTMLRGRLLLMDEERGRTEAQKRGITTKGTLGVLIAAYQADLITANQLRFYFDQISERADIWISPALCQRLLHEVLS